MISPQLDVHVGNVTAVHRWSDTHLSSRGGGGYVSAEYGGTISAPTITSKVVQRQEIYSRDREGRERRLDLSDAVVGFREGNGLLLVQLKAANSMQPELLYLLNLDTHEALAPDITFHRRTWSLFSGFWTGLKAGLLATVVAFLAIAYLNGVDVSRAMAVMTAAGVNQPATCAEKELTRVFRPIGDVTWGEVFAPRAGGRTRPRACESQDAVEILVAYGRERLGVDTDSLNPAT